MTTHAASFRDLVVCQKARAVAKDVFVLSQWFPREEMYSLTDQARRSSRSVGAQIAEAWGKRRYEKHFLSKLSDADGEQYETQHWVDTALDRGYVTREEADCLNDGLVQIGRMLNGMTAKSASFCGNDPLVVKEDSVEYFTP
ncbi:MAG: four helix bundle protein [bacterium]